MTSFSNFTQLDTDGAALAQGLMENADRARTTFDSFFNRWAAFNGWMSCVTEAGTERQMIEAISDDDRVTDAYRDMLRGSETFRRRVRRFSEMWPVINLRSARKELGRQFWRHDEDELQQLIVRHGVETQPQGWLAGGTPTWPQLLRTMYTVRNNLFHGSKSPRNRRDRLLVERAELVLRLFIESSECFSWDD